MSLYDTLLGNGGEWWGGDPLDIYNYNFPADGDGSIVS